MTRAATHDNVGRPNALASPAIRAATPRFQTRIMIVASRSSISESANDVIAAIASPPAVLHDRLNLNEACAARIAVMNAPIMLTTNTGRCNLMEISGRIP